jgi:hypothetical protein
MQVLVYAKTYLPIQAVSILFLTNQTRKHTTHQKPPPAITTSLAGRPRSRRRSRNRTRRRRSRAPRTRAAGRGRSDDAAGCVAEWKARRGHYHACGHKHTAVAAAVYARRNSCSVLLFSQHSDGFGDPGALCVNWDQVCEQGSHERWAGACTCVIEAEVMHAFLRVWM